MMRHKKDISARYTPTIYSILILYFFAFTANAYQALEYVPMTNLPGLTGTGSIPELLNSLYLIIIAVSATYGVIKIAIAGVKYTMSDVVTSKSESIADIKGVLIGLAIILTPYIILKTIYAPLLNLNILQNLGHIDTSRDSSNIESNTIRVDSGALLDTSSTADIKSCTDAGGFISKADSPDGKFTCVSKPKKPNTCNKSDAECMESCVFSGGTLGQDQGGFYVCR
ncbi:MAG TPA: hypothetical protein VFV22_00225 [Candidatus Paceibacterota bacterium]|nr:hypothetical protein [Candidatus Paceibacterota bacterium]